MANNLVPDRVERLIMFREKVSLARRQAGYLQKDLAAALGTDTRVLSRKLHGSGAAILSHQDVKQIIRTLASWDAITSRTEALALLDLMGLKAKSFSVDEWNSAPLNRLEHEHDSINITRVEFKEHAIPSVLMDRAIRCAPSIFSGAREQAIQTVCDRLRKNGAHLLALLDPGGISKTRLILEVAHEMQLDFADLSYLLSG